MKSPYISKLAPVLFLGILIIFTLHPLVNGWQSTPINNSNSRSLPKKIHPLPKLNYANEGSETIHSTFQNNRKNPNHIKTRLRLFQPLQKTTLRFWMFLQRHLYRLLGKDRWFRLKQKVRSITEKYTIYVLECEQGKYYVGSTQNKKKRFHQHLVGGRGSVWTRQYKPLRVLKQYKRIPKAYALGLESKVTAEAMLEYGINNVRGSMFCNVQNYTTNQLDPLTRFIGHYNDLNYAHVREVLREQLPSSSSSSSSSAARKKARQARSSAAKTRTAQLQVNGRQNATSNTAVETIEAQDIEWKTEDFVFAKRREEYQSRIDPKDRCYRCGRIGHWALNCPH